MKTFIQRLSSNTYTPLHAFLVGGDLLNEQYEAVKAKVDALLQAQAQLNFVLDKSPNINLHRMVNLSVVIPGFRSLFLAKENIGREDLGSVWFKEWFIQKTQLYELDRVSSLTTDTCSTMRSIRQALENSTELSHALFVPCNSHGLQLLIKDLTEQPLFAPVMRDAQQIVTSFHKAKKQYVILQSLQDQATAIILSCITR